MLTFLSDELQLYSDKIVVSPIMCLDTVKPFAQFVFVFGCDQRASWCKFILLAFSSKPFASHLPGSSTLAICSPIAVYQL